MVIGHYYLVGLTASVGFLDLLRKGPLVRLILAGALSLVVATALDLADPFLYSACLPVDRLVFAFPQEATDPTVWVLLTELLTMACVSVYFVLV